MDTQTSTSKKKGILDFFIERGPEPKSTPQSQTTPPVQQQPTSYSGYVTPTVGADPAIRQALENAIKTNQIEGFDYLKFKASLDSMKAVIPDEVQRYRAAFAMIQSMGVTKDKLLATGEGYLAVLDKQSDKFEEVLKAQVKKTVTADQEKINTLEAAIKDKQASIQKLADEVAVANKNLLDLNSQVADAKASIEHDRARFTATKDQFSQEIKSDLDKIKNYLQ